MSKVAIIGAGVSGMSVAHFLKDKNDVTAFEKESQHGGLIKCRRVNGSLFHTCGGMGGGDGDRCVRAYIIVRHDQKICGGDIRGIAIVAKVIVGTVLLMV